MVVPPLQPIEPADNDAVRDVVGSVTAIEPVAEHPLASLTVTLYVPAVTVIELVVEFTFVLVVPLLHV